MAYVLGFIFADGAIEDVQKSSRTCYLSIVCTSKDLSVLEKIRYVMNSHHKFYERLPKLTQFPGGRYYIPAKSFVFRIGSKLMYNDLLRLGVTPRKSLTIVFPQIPQDYLHFFIRGYFDGDGCLYLVKGKYPKVIFTSGSRSFLEGLSNSLSYILQIPLKSISSRIEKSGNPCYQLRYETSNSRKILEFMYRDLEKAPYMDRKFAIYQKSLSMSR